MIVKNSGLGFNQIISLNNHSKNSRLGNSQIMSFNHTN